MAGVGVEPVVVGGVGPQAASSMSRSPLRQRGRKRRKRNEFIKFSPYIRVSNEFFHHKVNQKMTAATTPMLLSVYLKDEVMTSDSSGNCS